MSHLNGLSPLWIAPMCWVNIVLVVKVLPHISHLNTFFLSWPEEIWVSDLLFIMKFNLKHFFTFFIFFDNYHSGCQIAEWLVVMETLILRVTHATYYQGTVLQFSKDWGVDKTISAPFLCIWPPNHTMFYFSKASLYCGTGVLWYDWLCFCSDFDTGQITKFAFLRF